MALKGVAVKAIVCAIDGATGLKKTGDAANITINIIDLDTGTVSTLTDTSVTEISSTNAPGYYMADVTAGEHNADRMAAVGKSSTPGITCIGYALDSPADVIGWKNATAPANTGDAYARLGAPTGASVSADIAAVPTAAQNAAAVAASSTPIPANVTQVNGSAASVATDLATASALETVDAVVDGIAANMATATAVANVSSDLSTMSNFVSGTLWDTLDLVYSGQNVIAGNTNGLGEMISDGAFTEAALANAPTAATVDLSPVTEVTDQLGGMISGGAFTSAALANTPTPEETAGTVLYTIDPVVDAIGNPIFGARVTVTTDQSGADFVTQQFTNEFGVCSFRLAPGVYYLRISADGKSDLVAQQITVEAE